MAADRSLAAARGGEIVGEAWSPSAMSIQVSVVIPCRDESDWITTCLESFANQDFPTSRFEVLVIDGMSNDGSRERIAAASDQHPMIRMIDNPVRVTPVAMNVGVAASRGEIILIAGAHNRYESTFLRRLVEHLGMRPEADAVGGVIVTFPRNEGRMGRAIARAISHPFGVGPSYFRTKPEKPVWADAAFGCGYRRRVFDRIGLFNERLTRGQDMELNRRLLAARGRILLAPDLKSDYFARSTLRDFWNHNFANGEWAVLPFLYSPIRPVGLRHLVPIVFVFALLAAILAAPFLPTREWAALGLAGTYAAVLFGASVHVAWRDRDLLLLPLVAVGFVSLHIGYGFGGLSGGLRVVSRLLRGERRPQPHEAWPCLDRYAPREAIT